MPTQKAVHARKRGAIFFYTASLVAMTIGMVIPSVVTASSASATSACSAPAQGAVNRTPGTKHVALTFDNGPSVNWTTKVLDILRMNGVNATFFVTGENVRSNPALIRRILDRGNLVGNHTESHPNLKGMSARAQGQQMNAATNEIVAAGGPSPCFFRAPAGSFDANTINEARRQGMSVIQWSNDTLDWAAPTHLDGGYQNSILNRAVQPLYTNPIIRMHDGPPENYRQNTVNSLQRIISYYKDHGYTFTDPSGRPFTSDNPIGVVDRVNSPEPGSLSIAGWAFDRNVPTSQTAIHVYINGVGYARTTTVPRPDVQARYPLAGAKVGYDFSLPAPGGRDRVTIYAINQGAGAHTVLYDKYINVVNGNPVGHVDVVGSPAAGQIRVAGWEFDPSKPLSPAEILVSFNGASHGIVTGVSRPDVHAAYPQTSTHQGFDATLPAPTGSVRVQVYGLNLLGGMNVLLIDKYVNVANPNPVGVLDLVYSPAHSHEKLRLAGWAFDPNSPKSNERIDVYVNGTGSSHYTGVNRPDVRKAYPQTSTHQGFDFTVAAPTGNVMVQVYLINIGPGVHNHILINTIIIVH